MSRYWLLRVHIMDKNDFHVLSTHVTEGNKNFDADVYVEECYPDNAQVKGLASLTKVEYDVMRKFYI